jgi:outer membrane protein assembly factor BamB
MREDFVTQLKLQLRDAAEREARRGRVGRAAGSARANGARPLLAAGGVAALAVCVVLAAGELSRRQPAPAHQPALHLVTQVDLTSGGGRLARGFGAVWVSDAGAGEVLRVAPANGRVLARIRTGGQPGAIAAGGGAVWTYDERSGRLLRINPASGRVTSRLPLGLQPHVDVVALDGRVWAGNTRRLLRIDPAGRRIVRRVSIGAGGLDAASLTADGRNIIVLGKDGKVVTYDGHTGAKLSSTAPPAAMFALDGAARYVISEFDNGGADHGFTAVDRSTGRTVWRRRISAVLVDQAIVSGPTLWAHGTGTAHGDTLWRIDANTGRVTGTLGLPDSGATALAPVRDRLWVLTPAGRLEIVSGA